MANSIYANARAKSLENGLLGKKRLLRMIDAPTVEDAFKILFEVNFGDGVAVAESLDFEKLIARENKKLIDFIKENCPSKAFKEFFLAENDFHNAEACIKAKYLKIDPDKMTIESGLIDKDYLKERIFVDEYTQFPEELSEVLKYCDLKFTNEKVSGAEINGEFKKGLYKLLHKVSKGDRFLSKLYSAKADFANISVALRSKGYSLSKNLFVPCGTLNQAELTALTEEPFDSLTEKYKYSPLREYVLSAIKDASKGLPLSDFEKSADDYALSLLEKNKYSSEGIIPFALYSYYKKAEIQNVRIIMVGLINGQSKNEIKGRMRNSYEG